MQRFDDRLELNSISYSMIQTEENPDYSGTIYFLFCTEYNMNFTDDSCTCEHDQLAFGDGFGHKWVQKYSRKLESAIFKTFHVNSLRNRFNLFGEDFTENSGFLLFFLFNFFSFQTTILQPQQSFFQSWEQQKLRNGDRAWAQCTIFETNCWSIWSRVWLLYALGLWL